MINKYNEETGETETTYVQVDGSIITINNGIITVHKIPEKDDSHIYRVTATAVAGGHQESIVVNLVRIIDATLQFNGVDILSNSNLLLEYVDKDQFEFGLPSIKDNYSDDFKDELDKSLSFETAGDIFDIEGTTLKLKKFVGSQEVTIYIGTSYSKTITIDVVDNSAVEFSTVFKNENYLYRVGNSNGIKLSSLFTSTKAGDYKIYIYHGKSGDNNQGLIATTDTSKKDDIITSTLSATPAAHKFLATYLAAYAADLSTLDGSLPEKAPPPCLPTPP